ncbi:hypothetical protein DQ04_00201260 [Trypanosoma grayi]|uniref:hypothetical protein n=1 Tax=Trypanosoma grayi TaxID=71804 RepID=UPI0004F40137|nr:hypothetical protein DQ04_00201260 [Trypanosoma grayi]KEG15073.1 hypothetical protein DQ04_00201260 [Trypanosoma grayi]
MRRAALLRAAPTPHASKGAAVDQQPSEGKRSDEMVLRLQDQLAKISERVAHADSVLQQYATGLSLAQRQQAVLERRIVALEEEAVRTQQKVTETTRIASDVVLQHRNVEALVRQMEKLILQRVASSPPVSATGKATVDKISCTMSEGCVEAEQQQQQPIEAPATGATAAAAVQISALSSRLEALQARVERLTMEKIVLDKVGPHAVRHQQKDVEMAVARAAATIAEPGSSERKTPVLSPQDLATVLRNTGAFPFKDNMGATRISSQKVLVRGMPVNFGATEVRDLFSRVGTVVSCVVRRAPAAAVAAAPVSSRYRSQRQEEDVENEPEHPAPSPPPAFADEQERAFEVTFHLVEQAVRAVLELDRYQLKGNHTLSVEPVVAADIIAALRQMEQESKKR